MTIAAIGPCILVAPLVVVAMVLAIPLWPVAIALVALLWLLVWPLERVVSLFGVRRFNGASAKVARWLNVVVRPWILFEPAPSPSPADVAREAQPEKHEEKQKETP